VNDAIADLDAMLLQQFGGCSDVLSGGGSSCLCVRSNYGTGILPSLFGCELFMMAPELQTLPTTLPLPGRERLLSVLDRGMPDLTSALGGRVFRAGEAFLDAMSRYPKIARHVTLYHPDLQGPIDLVELIWGSAMFLGFYDEPDLLRQLLDLVTQTYIAFMRKWQLLVPPAGDHSVHWGMLHRGTLMLRNDSLMNLSPQLYTQFVRPADQRLLDEFGGGAIHFCGRGDHFIEPMCQMRGLHAIHLTQPHLNDMETVYRNTVDKGICLVGFAEQHAAAAGRPLRGRVHVG
jgi:hypothetical protein